MPTYTKERIQTEGLEPTLQLLLRGVQDGRRVTYGTIAKHLERKLGIPKVFSTHIGGVAGALMDRVREVEPDAPLINILVVNGSDWEPGVGGDGYMKPWFGVTAHELSRHREHYVQQAINEVKAFEGWGSVYEKLFRTPLELDPVTDDLDDFEPDGQSDNPRFGRGGPEGEDHKRLKAFVRDNPQRVGIGGQVIGARNEAYLRSGDKMDVEFLVEALRIGVEVKSWRSGPADLERGIFQCVKYRAVMIAESGFDAEDANCDALLVTETPLPPALKSLARRLGIKHRLLVLNTPSP